MTKNDLCYFRSVITVMVSVFSLFIYLYLDPTECVDCYYSSDHDLLLALQIVTGTEIQWTTMKS